MSQTLGEMKRLKASTKEPVEGREEVLQENRKTIVLKVMSSSKVVF